MKKLFIMLAAVLCCGVMVSGMELPLIPLPQKVEFTDGGKPVSVDLSRVDKSVKDLGLPAEGYRLIVSSDGVELTGQDDAGLLYGETTLGILNAAYGGKIPSMELEDYPLVGYRGLMVDVARHYIPFADLKKFVELMSRYKYNVMHLHLTDDQGWRMEISSYPRLTEVGSGGNGFYTKEELKELVKFAAERNITIIPELELPGHSMAALTSYPEFGCTGGPYKLLEGAGVSEDILCGGNPEVMNYIDAVIGEMAEIFPAEYVHIGGDECPLGRWTKCPKCLARIAELGLSDVVELERYFIREVAEIASRHGKKIIGWDELLNCGVPESSVVMSWRGNYGALTAAELGRRTISTSYSHLYFDYAQGKTKEEYAPGASCISTRRVYSYDPTLDRPGLLDYALLGAQGNLWSEGIWSGRMLEYKATPRLLALSEALWNMDSRDYDSFMRRLAGEFVFLRDWGVMARYTPIELPQIYYFDDEFVLDIGELPAGVDLIYTLDGSDPRESSTAKSYKSERPRAKKSCVLTMRFKFDKVIPGLTTAPEYGVYTSSELKKVRYLPAVRGPEDPVSGLWFRVSFAGDKRSYTYLGDDFYLEEVEKVRAGRAASGKAVGYFYAPESGNYEFSVAAGGKVKIRIDGHKVVDATGNGVYHSTEGSIGLASGFHRLEVDFELTPANGHGGRMQLYSAYGAGQQYPLSDGFLYSDAMR